MKKVSLLFLISFVFSILGQTLWMIVILSESPLFGSPHLEEWFIYFPFTFCSIFGLIGSYKWYKNSQDKKDTNPFINNNNSIYMLYR